MLPLFQTGGGSLPSPFLSLISYLPNAKIVDSYKAFALPGAASQNDIYTVPAGKRALLCSFSVSNASGATASTFQPTVKIGGTYFKLNGVTASIAAGAGTGVNAIEPYIAEAGETYSILQTTNTTFFIVAQIIEFDATSSLKTVKVTGPASGDNLIYTAPAGKSAWLVGHTFLGAGYALQAVIGVAMMNATGALTGFLNYLRGAAAASTSNRICGSTTFAAGVVTITIGVNFVSVASGDSLSLNLSGANASGMAWVNLIEF